VTDSGSGAHHPDVASVCLPDVPLIVAMRYRAFAKIADDLDIFVVVEAKSRVGSDLIVVEHDEKPNEFQQLRRELDVTILTPLALLDPSHHALAIDVGSVQMNGPTCTHPGPVHRAEDDVVRKGRRLAA
jgi:hypothetical protein